MARLSRASGVSPSPPVSVPDSDAALTTSTSTEQHLLTPATSLSESSSMSGTPVMGVEKNDTEGTVTAERRSRRVTRSSLVMAVGAAMMRELRIIRCIRIRCCMTGMMVVLNLRRKSRTKRSRRRRRRSNWAKTSWGKELRAAKGKEVVKMGLGDGLRVWSCWRKLMRWWGKLRRYLGRGRGGLC
ncbi:histone-lysine N-methyltransferase [Histoplasma capsulatum]|uniref:Histone-lysine N-methyltransferase n=1 Tax=Ajellomyces capsulatus TaxID=5037 RepID=A0A8A1M0A6_AJECA|nr:histone-lysine N-methyltransferase [Histoplasma capsulatum]